MPGVEVRLVDPVTGDDVEAAGEGEGDAEGEVWVRGPGLMAGYHNQPEATAAALKDGWYRTGDLGRRVEHGHLLVTGRVSELIIRGGENIHPTEIEQELLHCPGVADAVVVGKPHQFLGEVPVAFVVPSPEGLDVRAVLADCRARLADYKVPVEIHETAAVPRTASGKMARHLVDRGPAQPVAEPAPAAPAVTADALREMVLAETNALCGQQPYGHPEAERPFAERSFIDLGLTSIGAVTLSERLGKATGLRLPTTLVFDHPTPEAVVRHLRAALASPPAASDLSGTPADVSGAAAGPGTYADDDPVVIVAMACRYPGDVDSPEDLWHLVSEGRDAVSDFPVDRGWDLTALYDPDADRLGTSYARSGGFRYRAGEFDAGLFGISPREALAIDPQQRLLLESSWELLERAGIDPVSLRGSDTGVFVGVMYDDYANRLDVHELEAHLGLGSAGSVASGRISYTYGWPATRRHHRRQRANVNTTANSRPSTRHRQPCTSSLAFRAADWRDVRTLRSVLSASAACRLLGC